ncbi:isocitrate dehydrogenase (NAD+) [Peptoclostridium litorale DSM 5388]|uniref:Isocitrate dehydrogenase n=1 Tax=Peptoclostridium litorale DSM 5388 TaxID=1121324 RepID=A0A069RAZ8_PEPLI|nr:isocitrate dehydrogenase (NAD(+)) [Peptoclostridium litorale]KDR94201.1 isocitrate dehydrogenase [Peptoclostridium litorale DSM 5388]SIN82208.1 isocitrate dehydrogenase (NAD+) [Peptoclostridium litorale DSM 5388]
MVKVTLIPGDGIGPEVAYATRDVIDATGAQIEWEEVNAGETVYKEKGTFIPDELIESINKNRIAFKGPITTPVGKGFKSINVTLRQKYKTYANVRPVKSIPGVKSPFNNIDLVIMRENTEDLYAGIEHEVTEGVTEAIKVITEEASTKIAEFAFKYAIENGRKKVTAVHKANIMKITDGLFIRCARKVAEKYPQIEYEEVIVDNMCMQLVMYPEKYDVLVLPNLYGDIVSDLCAGLVGGLGLVPGANIGDDIGIFEAVHGSAPDIAGQNLANPIACILSGAMLLDYIGEKEKAQMVRKAVWAVMEEGKVKTRDLGGTASTKEITAEICRQISLQK